MSKWSRLALVLLLLTAGGALADAEELFEDAEEYYNNKSYHLALENYEELISRYSGSRYVPQAMYKAARSAEYLSEYEAVSGYYLRLAKYYGDTYWGALAKLQVSDNMFWWSHPELTYPQTYTMQQQLLFEAAETMEDVKDDLDEPYDAECVDKLARLYMRLGNQAVYNEDGGVDEDFDADAWWWENYKRAVELEPSADIAQEAYYAMGQRRLGRIFVEPYPEEAPTLQQWRSLMAERYETNLEYLEDALEYWGVILENWPECRTAHRIFIDRAEYTEVFLDSPSGALELYREAAERYEDDWDKSGEASNNVRRLTTPNLDLPRVAEQLPTGEKLSFSYTSRLAASAELRLYRLTEEQLIGLYDGTFPEVGQDKPYERDVPDLDGLELVFSESLELPGINDYHPHYDIYNTDNPGPGLYLLTALVDGELSSATSFTVSDLGAFLANGYGGGYVWSAWLEDGDYAPGANLNVWESYYDSRYYHELWRSDETDRDGWVQFETPHEEIESPVAVVETQGHYALVDSYDFYALPEFDPVGCALTDRTLYKPGDTVFFEIHVREEVNPSGRIYGYEPVADLELTVEAYAGDLIYEGELVTDRRGRCGASFDIPEDVQLGYINLNAYWTDADDYTHSIVYQDLRLEEYKKPEFDVSVSLERGPLRLGGEARAAVSASFLSGEPLADGEVRYTVSRTPRYWMPEFPTEDDKILPPWFEAETQDDYYYYYWWYNEPETVYTGSAVLDDEGRADFPVVLIPPEGDPNAGYLESGWYTYYYDFNLDLTVADSTGRAVDGSASTQAARHLYQPAVSFENGTVAKGDDWLGDFTLIDLFDEPAVEREVAVNLYEMPSDYSWYYTGLEDEPWLTFTGVTDDDGVLELEIDTDILDPGSYLLALGFTDPWSGEREYYHYLYLTEEPVEPEEVPPSLTLSLDEEFYVVGDTATVTIDWNKEPVEGMLVVESGGLMREHYPVDIREGQTTQPIELTGHHAPSTSIRLLTFYERQTFNTYVITRVVPEEKILNVEVLPGQEQYGPGETASLEVRVTDWQGNPVQSRLTLTAFDKSLFVLGAQPHLDIRSHFFRDFNYGNLSVYSSADSYIYSDFIDHWAHPAGELPHGWLLDNLGLVTSAEEIPAPSAYAPEEKAMAESPMMMAGDFMLEAVDSMAAGAGGMGGADEAEQSARYRDSASELLETMGELVREDFRDTAYWQTQVRTDARGRAEVSFQLPDDLTGWRVVAWAYEDDRVGQAETDFRTTLPVITRLGYPRYLTAGDECTLTLSVRNNAARTAAGQAGMVAEQNDVKLLDELRDIAPEAGGEAVLDFRLAVEEAGLVSLTGLAQTDRGSDAQARRFEVIDHGAPIYLFESGRTEDDPYRFTFRMPEQIDPEQTHLRVWLHPSLAAGLKESLYFLQEYPYNCVEQTASRFWPAAVFARAMNELGVPDHLAVGSAEDSITEGVTRLYGTQNADGGWPWWAGGYSSEHITSYVLVALHEVGDLDWIDNELERKRLAMAENGLDYLERRLEALEPDETLALYSMYALALWDHDVPSKVWRLTYDTREQLGSYSRALLALFLHENGEGREARQVIENMEGYAEITDEDAYWGDWEWGWYWWQDRVETTALSLKALLAIDPEHELMEKAAHWLLVNRRANRWKSTIDTSLCVWTLMDYLEETGELEADYTAVVELGDEVLASTAFEPEDVWGEGAVYERFGEEVQPGELPMVFRKEDGPGRLYFTASLEYYSKEELIPAHWDTVRVERQLYLVGEDDETLTPLTEVDNTITVGDYVEVVLTVESPNDFDYVAVEDPRIAGCEFLPKDRSGWDWRSGTYREIKEKLTAFFYQTLTVGEHEIRYRVRAERPGVYHVLPTQLYGMYAVDIRANAAEVVVTVNAE
jgi:hypothetical protein